MQHFVENDKFAKPERRLKPERQSLGKYTILPMLPKTLAPGFTLVIVCTHSRSNCEKLL